MVKISCLPKDARAPANQHDSPAAAEGPATAGGAERGTYRTCGSVPVQIYGVLLRKLQELNPGPMTPMRRQHHHGPTVPPSVNPHISKQTKDVLLSVSRFCPTGLGTLVYVTLSERLCGDPIHNIVRRLHHAGLHAHRPLPRLSLTPRHRHQRLQWCRTRLSWSDSEWQRVIFSDESRFSLGGDAQRIRVWRHRGQHQDERFAVTRPEGLVSPHLLPYRTICRNCVRMFKLHEMDYHRTPSGTSTAPYRDVWRVGLANTAAR
ncbi:hypothetical protein NFI96_000519 [Prochilodus magdalenae]|nr:hypothetical protein NFI96_000519 [Prochilodus magdalenae]